MMTLEQAKGQGFETHVFDNGDWCYEDTDSNYHLFRGSKELTEGIVAKNCYSYNSGDWDYIDVDGNYHLFRDDKELTEGVVAKDCFSYKNGNWKYEDIEGKVHLIKSPKDIKPAKTEYKARVKTKDDEVIEDLTHTLISAQEYFDVDLMPEIMAIANKISKRKDK